MVHSRATARDNPEAILFKGQTFKGRTWDNPKISIPLELQKQKVFSFDTTRYQFAELVLEVLDPDHNDRREIDEELLRRGKSIQSPELKACDYLSLLHLSRIGRRCQKKPPRSGHDPYRRRWTHGLKHPEVGAKISELVANFVKEVLGPMLDNDMVDEDGSLLKEKMTNRKSESILNEEETPTVLEGRYTPRRQPGDDETAGTTTPRRAGTLLEETEQLDHETSEFLQGKRWIYQTEASIRVHLADVAPLGVPHTDSDYFHQPSEINFWFPINHKVQDSNSLYCESEPGKGDFFRVDETELGMRDIVRNSDSSPPMMILQSDSPFRAHYGEGIRFYGNKCRHYTVKNTTDVTRVSIDLRVIPKPLYFDNWSSPTGKVPFRIGGYYTAV